MIKTRLIRNITAIIPLPLSIAFFMASAMIPEAIETLYSRKIYPLMASVLSRAADIFPFSAAEFLIYGAIIFILWKIAPAIKSLVKKKGERKTLLKDMGRGALLWAGIIYFLFILLWGLNYHRRNLGDSLGLDSAEATTAEINECLLILARRANSLAPEVCRNSEGLMMLRDQGVTRGHIIGAYKKFTDPALPLMNFGKTKPFAWSRILTLLGIGGFYFPFTGEPSYNRHMPAVSLPFAMAHETAHQRGFARENEANFLAYLVCRDSAMPELQYSAALTGLMYLMAALDGSAPELLKKNLAHLSESVKADMRSRNDFWSRDSGLIRDGFQAWNDLFLRANMQKDGSRSYGRFVELMAAANRKGSL
jgi:hypothetical protein